MTDLLLGLDIGTTATKCVLVDPGRGVVAADSRPVTLATEQAGWAEEDPATWWRHACELIPAVLTAAGAGGGDVRGIGVAGMVPALLCLDEAGRPLRPSIQQNDASARRRAGPSPTHGRRAGTPSFTRCTARSIRRCSTSSTRWPGCRGPARTGHPRLRRGSTAPADRAPRRGGAASPADRALLRD